MERPAWFERLARAYLAGEGSLFLVTGGDPAAIEAVLVAELTRTRPIVGIVRGRRPAKPVAGGSASAGLTFPKLGDLAKFENMLAGRRVLGGLPHLATDRPLDALGAIWAVLELPEPPQGWIVQDPDAFLPARKEAEPLGGGAPPLAAWATAPRLRSNNHLVVVVAGSGALHPSLAEAAVVVDAREEAPSAAAVAEPAPAEIRAPSPPPSAGPLPVADLSERLAAALARRLPGWPAAAFPSRAPVMAAVADVLAGLPEPPCDAIEVRWDPEAGAVLEGPGAEWLRSRWASDVAVDAAAGMIVKGLQPPEGGYGPGGAPETDPVGTRVLARRIERWFTG